MKRFFLLPLLITILSISLKGQETQSYVYIEGIKGIPFTLRLNNEVVSSLNKGYYLCPMNTTGKNIMTLEFIDQQYPNQQFILDADQQSAFGFKLSKTADDQFYLLDLINNGKIIETNSNVNIGLTTELNRIKFGQVGSNELSSSEDTKKMSRRELKKMRKSEESNLPQPSLNPSGIPVLTRNPSPNKKVVDHPGNKGTPTQAKLGRTIANDRSPVDRKVKSEAMEVKPTLIMPERRVGSTPITEPIVVNEQEAKKQPDELNTDPSFNRRDINRKPSSGPKVMMNSCSQIANDREVNAFVSNLNLKTNEADQFIALKRKVFAGCVTCNQLYRIVACFETPEMKLAAVEVLHFTISDLQNLLLLEGLFKNEADKEKLKELMYE